MSSLNACHAIPILEKRRDPARLRLRFHENCRKNPSLHIVKNSAQPVDLARENGLGGEGSNRVIVQDNPINFTDPNGENIYGNWCGPGGGGPTKDGVDAICKKHDECFDKTGAIWKDNVFGTKDKQMKQCMDDCNKKLCDDLRSYQPKTYSEIFGRSAVMLYFGCSN